MKYEELCAALVAECELGCDYVVQISSSYHHETIGTFGECVTYEIFNVDLDDNIIWFNDWYEGQADCYYEKPILINDLIRAYNTTKAGRLKTLFDAVHQKEYYFCPNCGHRMEV